MATNISLAEARAKLSELVGRAEDHHERFVITVHGKPVAVLVGVYDFESMAETLEILADKDLMSQLEDSEREIAEGKIILADDRDAA